MTGFGYDPNHSIVRASQEGLQAVLFKPFKVDQLLTEVRRALQPPARLQWARVKKQWRPAHDSIGAKSWQGRPRPAHYTSLSGRCPAGLLSV